MAERLIGYQALIRRLDAIKGPVLGADIMKTLAATAVRESKLLVPRKTGNLGRSIHVGAVTATSAQVIASANYAGYVERGTRAHEITPKAARALRWAAKGVPVRLTGTPTKAAQRAGGAWAFATRVHHPGTHPHPYMLPGAVRAVQNAHLEERIVARWNEAA